MKSSVQALYFIDKLLLALDEFCMIKVKEMFLFSNFSVFCLFTQVIYGITLFSRPRMFKSRLQFVLIKFDKC